MAQMTKRRRFTPTAGVPRGVLFLAVPPVQPLDLFGPLEVFRGANLLRKGHEPYLLQTASWRSCAAATEAGPSIEMGRAAPFDVRTVDTFVVTGGEGAVTTADAGLSTWVRSVAGRARRTVSICTGAFVLARAGLLDGRTATTHWVYASELRRAFPRVRIDDDRIWVEDRGVFTSAGVCTGIDLALALVADDCGAELALRVARALVVFVQRSGGQAQFSAALAAQRAESRPVRDVQAWVSERLGERHTVEGLAKRAGMSPRNFTRVFTREAGCPPARFLARLRVEAARRALERSGQTVEEIAATFGFGSAEVMTRAFKRELRTTPAAYRDGFARRRAPRATKALTEKGPLTGAAREGTLGAC